MNDVYNRCEVVCVVHDLPEIGVEKPNNKIKLGNNVIYPDHIYSRRRAAHLLSNLI